MEIYIHALYTKFIQIYCPSVMKEINLPLWLYKIFTEAFRTWYLHSGQCWLPWSFSPWPSILVRTLMKLLGAETLATEGVHVGLDSDKENESLPLLKCLSFYNTAFWCSSFKFIIYIRVALNYKKKNKYLNFFTLTH